MAEVQTLLAQIDGDKETPVAQRMFWAGKIRERISANGKRVFVYTEYPDIEVEYKDLLRIKEDTYASVMAELNSKLLVTEPVAPTVETPVQPEGQAPVVPATPDMLVNTGYTAVMPPVDEKIMEPPVVDTPILPPATNVPLATGLKMTKKPMSFNKKPNSNSQSGFAEVIVLGVVVLVYIAIIVNLIIRLK